MIDAIGGFAGLVEEGAGEREIDARPPHRLCAASCEATSSDQESRCGKIKALVYLRNSVYACFLAGFSLRCW